MTYRHIIEIRGGPHDGHLLDLADIVYPINAHHHLPGSPCTAWFGVPIYTERRPDGLDVGPSDPVAAVEPDEWAEAAEKIAEMLRGE